jgi:hypothetical protein
LGTARGVTAHSTISVTENGQSGVELRRKTIAPSSRDGNGGTALP